jgi:hypothetical protein
MSEENISMCEFRIREIKAEKTLPNNTVSDYDYVSLYPRYYNRKLREQRQIDGFNIITMYPNNVGRPVDSDDDE